eukprot:scaffold12802_cov136-Skeletonema_marinoi.AAC.1
MAVVSNASSGHLRRCNDADTSKYSLSREKDASILSWPSIMGHWKQLIAIFTTEGMAVVSNASSGHLRGYSLADTSKYSLSRAKDASLLSWPISMGH